MSTSKLTDTILQELRCQCGKYLSSAPVYLQNGQNLCSDCADGQEEATRNTLYEAIASLHQFPCKYKPEGCPKYFQFDQLESHEDRCVHRVYECPASQHLYCDWKGFVSDLTQHYEERHPDLFLRSPNFSISIKEDYEVYRLINVDNFVIFLQTKCDVESGKLWFNAVSLLPLPRIECSIRLISNDLNRNMEVKNKRLSFHSVRMVPEKSLVVSISTILEFFGDTEFIVGCWKIKAVLLKPSENEVNQSIASRGEKRRIGDDDDGAD